MLDKKIPKNVQFFILIQKNSGIRDNISIVFLSHHNLDEWLFSVLADFIVLVVWFDLFLIKLTVNLLNKIDLQFLLNTNRMIGFVAANEKFNK